MLGPVIYPPHRRRHYVWLVGWLSALWSLAGCAHLVETRTIERFSKALESGDLEQLKIATSDGFEERALRKDAALEDLKVLRLPTGEIEIADVDEVSPAVKRVTVFVGESKQRLKYQLKLDPKTKKWVVDDIYLKQKHDGVTATKSVSEQMDLLLSVREFLEAWRNGSREDVLSTTTPEFAKLLRPLSPEYLSRLTRQVVGRQKTGSRLHTRAQLDENMAYVRLPIGTGEMLLTINRSNGSWLVDEVAISSRDEKDAIPSTRQLAQITSVATAFLAAYNSADKQQLEPLCTPKFFTGSLAPANLAQVSLPSGDLPPESTQVHVAWQGFSASDAEETRQLRGKHSNFIVEGPNEVLKLSIVRHDAEVADAVPNYLIEDVTLYELDSQQEKRLSALFTAHALVQIFAEALASRDLETLQHKASPDFYRRVWKSTDAGMLHEMPLTEIEDAPPKVQSTVFSGPITEVTVTQGSRALTYVLLDQQGSLVVDDVLMPTLGRPSSLKTTLELMVPILDFAAGVRLGQLENLQRNSSRDFNRLVWYQTPTVPPMNGDVASHLHAPLVSIEQTDDHATIVLGDDKRGAHVTLVREAGQHVIDEMWLISGSMPRDRVELKRALRMHIATYGVGKEPRNETTSTTSPTTARQ